MRADRLLSELMLLQARERVTGRELAERLEVSERTVHRDMEALISARVPLAAVRGAQGGWELEKGWRTQVPGLDEAELRALLMAQPRMTGDSRLAAAAERALNKLMAALPGPMQAQAAAMRERLHVDPTGWRDSGEDLSMLAAVQNAVSGDKKLQFDYTRADGQKALRTVDPLGMVAKGSTWYLVAKAANGMRTYRVSRMQAVTVLAVGFERSAQFDLSEYWKASMEQLDGKWAEFEVMVQVTQGAAPRLLAWGAAEVVADETPTDDAIRDWVTMKARFEDEGQARFVVLGLGNRARVIEPEGFKRKIQEEVQLMAKIHGLLT